MLLGLLVDVLAGVMSGPNCSFQAPVFENNTGGEPRVGQFFIAISPTTFSMAGEKGFSRQLESMLNALANEPGVRLPGVRRDEFRQQAEQNGVEVPQELIDRLEAFAAGGAQT
jgi:(2R)-3-sulfolactate dehydrogenase (NADP+)